MATARTGQDDPRSDRFICHSGAWKKFQRPLLRAASGVRRRTSYRTSFCKS